MEELKENAMQLYTNFNQNLRKEFEKKGLAQHCVELQGFQSNVEKSLEELLNEVKVNTAPQIPPPPTMDSEPPQTRNQLKSSPSTLVIQFGKSVNDNDDSSLRNIYEVKNWQENFPSGHVILGELLNGNCRVQKAPAVFGWHPVGKLVCMKAAISLATSSDSPPPELWECNNRAGKELKDIEAGYDEKIHLKFSPQFLTSFLIQEMKMFAKASTPSTLTTAIITFPMHYTCKQRVHLKDAAELAGFQDVYLISEEGLTAYFWFANRVEQKDNKFSKNVVIVTCGTSSFVMYRRLFESQENGRQKMIVEAVHSVNFETETQIFFEQLKKMNISEAGCHIPVLCKYVDSTDPSPDFRHLLKSARLNGYSLEIVKNEEINYFAVRAATRFSDKPEDLKRSIRNALGTSVLIGVEEAIASSQLLPKTCSRVTCTIKHFGSPHKLTAYYTCGKDWMGNLWVNGVRKGAQLKVIFEITWEGIWKVVSIITKKKNCDPVQCNLTWTWIPSIVDYWRAGNGSLVLKTSQARHWEEGVDLEKSKVGAPDGGTTVYEGAQILKTVAVAGLENVKKRQALMDIQPNENVMMNIHLAKKIKLDFAEVSAEQDIMKQNDVNRK